MNKKLFYIFFLAVLLLTGAYFLLTSGEKPNKSGQVAADTEETGSFLKNILASESDMNQEYVAGVYGRGRKKISSSSSASSISSSSASSSSSVSSATAPLTSFYDYFSSDFRIEETGSLSEAGDPNWWVNSGAWFISSLGAGKTFQGDLSQSDKWYRIYLQNNPIDTDNGFHPQNIFRFVQRGQWSNLNQQAYFKINKLNLSDSPNRNASNGLLLFNRYQNGDNLYYLGIRVDGAAVIKKKINGSYYTMAYKQIFSGAKYDRIASPNLLPINSLVGLKGDLITNSDNTVSIKLYVDVNKTGNWTLVLEAVDDGIKYGGGAILREGYVGIRTDFMDVEFDDYRVVNI